jgi:hypothetical protein
VASYTSGGTLNWAKSIGSIDDEMGIGVVTDVSGNVFVSGYFQGSATDFDPGAGTFPLTAANNDIFLLKLDASGNFSWAKQMGGPNDESAYNLATDVSGNLLITGYYNGIPDFDPDAGVTNLIAAGGMDAYIGSYSSSGALNWVRGLGGSTTDVANGICADALGNVYTVGTFTSTVDMNTNVVGSLYFTSLGAKDGFVHKISAATTGVSTLLISNVRAYPNPANDLVNIYVECPDLSANVSMTDMVGHRTETKAEWNNGSLRLDLSHITAGTYTLEIRTSTGIATTKVIKL